MNVVISRLIAVTIASIVHSMNPIMILTLFVAVDCKTPAPLVLTPTSDTGDLFGLSLLGLLLLVVAIVVVVILCILGGILYLKKKARAEQNGQYSQPNENEKRNLLEAKNNSKDHTMIISVIAPTTSQNEQRGILNAKNKRSVSLQYAVSEANADLIKEKSWTQPRTAENVSSDDQSDSEMMETIRMSMGQQQQNAISTDTENESEDEMKKRIRRGMKKQRETASKDIAQKWEENCSNYHSLN